MAGKGVLVCYMTLRNDCIEFDPGMVGKGVLTCYMTLLRNGCIEFDPGVVVTGVLACHMTLLRNWSILKLAFPAGFGMQRLICSSPFRQLSHQSYSRVSAWKCSLGRCRRVW